MGLFGGKGASLHSTRLNDKQTVLQFLENNSLFEDKKESERKEACKYFQINTYNKGDYIALQDEIGDRLYIIVSGTVEFTRSTEEGERTLRKYSKNEIFGDYALVHQSHRNTNNARAFSNRVMCLELDRESYQNNIRKKCLSNLKTRIDEAGQDIVWKGLETIPFLQGFTKDKIQKIGSFFQFQAFPKGYCIYREGDFGKRFYVLLSGELVVTMVDDLGFNLELTRIQPVKTFGEAALIEGKRREATVTTMTESTVFFMESDDFQDFLFYVPTLKDRLLQSIQDTDFSNLFTKNIPIFSELTPLHKYRLGVGSTRIKIPKGRVIKEEGEDMNQNFYIIVEGSVNVTKNDRFVRTLEKGDYFGEVGLISENANTATVTVSSEEACTCIAIKPQIFQSICVDEPSVASEISIRLLGDQCKLSDILVHPQARKAFTKHLIKEYAKENIDFWLKATELEDIDGRVIKKSVLKALGVDVDAVKAEKKRLLKQRVTEIFEIYVKADGAESVNMSGEIREKLVKRMENDDISFDMFAQARKEVYGLLNADTFRRFKTSDTFQELLDNIGRYSPNRASYRIGSEP